MDNAKRRKARYARSEQVRHRKRQKLERQIVRLEWRLVLPLERLDVLELLELWDLVVDIWRVRLYPVPWAEGREEIWARWSEPGDEELLASFAPPPAERPMTAAERQRRLRKRRAAERETDARCRAQIAQLERLFGLPLGVIVGADVIRLATGLTSEMLRRMRRIKMMFETGTPEERTRVHLTFRRFEPAELMWFEASMARTLERRPDVPPRWDIEPDMFFDRYRAATASRASHGPTDRVADPAARPSVEDQGDVDEPGGDDAPSASCDGTPSGSPSKGPRQSGKNQERATPNSAPRGLRSPPPRSG